MRTIQLKDGIVAIDDEAKRVVTRWSDGQTVDACPMRRDEDIARAWELGYEGDVWRMTAEHDLLHSLLAQAQGYRRSLALRLAHKEHLTARQQLMVAREEGLVLAVQGLLNYARQTGKLVGEES